MAGRSRIRCIDCSGAPPMLIPKKVASLWRGTTDPRNGKYSKANLEDPVTDHDRACAASFSGNGVLEFRTSLILVFYTEDDLHSWDSLRQIVLCGWAPSDLEMSEGVWTDPMEWIAKDEDFLLMNSAVDASRRLAKDDFLEVHLKRGEYCVETCHIDNARGFGYFHRFTLSHSDRIK